MKKGKSGLCPDPPDPARVFARRAKPQDLLLKTMRSKGHGPSADPPWRGFAPPRQRPNLALLPSSQIDETRYNSHTSPPSFSVPSVPLCPLCQYFLASLLPCFLPCLLPSFLICFLPCFPPLSSLSLYPNLNFNRKSYIFSPTS